MQAVFTHRQPVAYPDGSTEDHVYELLCDVEETKSGQELKPIKVLSEVGRPSHCTAQEPPRMIGLMKAGIGFYKANGALRYV